MYVIVFLFFFIISLMFAGIHYFGPQIFRAKSTSAVDTLETTVGAIVSWSEANNRQLANSANFPRIIPNPTDPYGQPLYYIYDNNLTSLTSGGLCGRSFTTLSVNFCPNAACASPTTQINNVAFVLLSSGNDLKVETLLNGTFNNSSFNGPVSSSGYANATINIYSSGVAIAAAGNYPYDDITRIVTLNELKSRVHCAGVTRGRLMLLNNELPGACANSAYAATVYPDGGVPNSGNYSWCSSGAGNVSGSISANPNTGCTGGTSSTQWSSGSPTLSFSGTTGGTGNYPITVMLEDNDTTPNFVQRNYVLSVSNCGAANSGGATNLNTANNAPVGGGTTTQFSTGGSNASNSAATNSFANNIVTNVAGANNSVLSAQNNVLTFGYNVNNGEACIWFPGNFPLLGKILRAFWNFCFKDIETGAANVPAGSNCPTCPNCTTCPWCTTCGGTNCTACAGGCNAVCPNCSTSGMSTCFADGYTFTLMQAYNPTTYCGTGTAYDANLNPFYNCSDAAPPTYTSANHLGEFLSYCGLPGASMAAEFDIFPNNANTNSYGSGRGDPANNDNHVAIVHSISTHSSGDSRYTFPSGTYGDNTHGQGTSPYVNPTCAAANSSSSGCLYGEYYNGANNALVGANNSVTWMEDGCNPGYTTHNARVEVHTRCSTNNYTSCDNPAYCSTSSYDCMEVWIDKGNSNLNSNAGTAPDVYYCFQHPTSMNQVKIGFTEGTGGSEQLGYIANFSASVASNCTVPSISTVSSPASLLQTSGTCNGTNAPSCSSTPCLCLTSGQLLAAQLSASGGTGSYTWNLGAANITGVAASNIPSWLSLQTSGNCGSYNCTGSAPCLCGNAPAGNSIYNTILASVTDTCTQECNSINNNTASQSYVINVACPTLSITTSSLPSGIAGTTYSTFATMQASGSDTSLTWSVPSSGPNSLPAGLNLNSSTGVISGKPTTAGTYTPTITVTSSSPCSATASQQYTVQIYGVPTCTLTPASNPVAYSNTLGLNWTVTNNPASATWTASPGGISASCSSPSVSGGGCTTAGLTIPGTNTFTLTVTNPAGTNNCSATVNVGCAAYRVWNNYNTTARYFSVQAPGATSGVCTSSKVAQNSEITTANTLTSSAGVDGYINRYRSSDNSCPSGTPDGGSITYTNAMNGDIGHYGGSGICCVCYDTDGATAGWRSSCLTGGTCH